MALRLAVRIACAWTLVCAPLVAAQSSRSAIDPIPKAELDAARWVEGRVVLPPGTPEDEHILVVGRGRKFSNGELHRAELDREGRFRVALEKRTRSGWLSIESRYAVLGASVQVPDSATTPIVIVPKLGARLRGKCRLAPALASRAASLRGVRVEILGGGSDEPLHHTAALDGELAFEYGGLATGRELTISLPSELGFVASTRIAALSPGESRTIELDVRPGATLRGIVLGEDGQPIDEVRVYARLRGDESPAAANTGAFASIKTSAGGAFELTGLRAGDWEIETSATDRLTAALRVPHVAEGETRADLRIVLPSGRSIRGRAMWPDDDPVVGAEVEWRSLGESGQPSFGAYFSERKPVVTGPNGAFVITALEDGPYRLQIGAVRPGTGTAVWHAIAENVKPDAGELVLVMKRATALRGRVVDDAGEPVTSFTVHTFHAQGAPGREIQRAGPDASFRDPDGRFVLEQLWDGEWDLCVQSESAAQAAPLHVVLPAQEAPVEIRVLRYATLSGIVVDPNGHAVPRAKIEITVDEAGQSTCPSDFVALHQARDDGGFDIVAPTGWIDIRAAGESWADSPSVRIIPGPGDHVTGIEIALSRGGRIAGSVLDSRGRPAAGCQVRMTHEDGHGVSMTDTDERGAFHSDALAPGEYMLIASRAERGDEPHITHVLRNVRVREDETTEVVLGAPKPAAKIRVHGTVRADGAPVEDIRIEASRLADNPSFEGVSVRSGGDGRYELLLERSGWHMFTLYTPTTHSLRRVRVPNQPDFELDCTIPSGGVSGRVIGPAGKPLAGIGVSIAPDRESADRTETYTGGDATTGEDGAFEFDHLAPATYRVQAGRAGSGSSRVATYGQAASEGIQVREGTRENVELRVTKSCVLTGSIRYMDGSAGAGIEVFARDGNGALVHWDRLAVTDPAGEFRIDGLGAGKVTVFARGVGYASRESSPVALDPALPAKVELVLENATRLYVDVVDSKGNSLSGVQVRVYDEQGRDCNVDVDDASPDDELDGYLEATLPSGTYRVLARHKSGSSATGMVVLTPGRSAANVALTMAP